MGAPTGTTFYKKFLLKKAPNKSKEELKVTVPMDLTTLPGPYEETIIFEDFIDHKSSVHEVLESSIQRRGNTLLGQLTYFHKLKVKVNNQIIQKKRNIHAVEYLNLLDKK